MQYLWKRFRSMSDYTPYVVKNCNHDQSSSAIQALCVKSFINHRTDLSEYHKQGSDGLLPRALSKKLNKRIEWAGRQQKHRLNSVGWKWQCSKLALKWANETVGYVGHSTLFAQRTSSHGNFGKVSPSMVFLPFEPHSNWKIWNCQKEREERSSRQLWCDNRTLHELVSWS